VREGAVARTIRWIAANRLLPESYTLGLAETLSNTSSRGSYLLGQHSNTGWWYYFPVAFAVKTPIATQIFFLAGLAAMWRSRRLLRTHAVLVIGLMAFVILYGAYLLSSNLNIGLRHLMPIYPALFVLAGAVTCAVSALWPRGLILAGVACVAVSVALQSPHQLAYFHELVGGPRAGHRYLADSNLDWGQDLHRLRRFADRGGGDRMYLCYFGSADPRQYGFNVILLPGMFPWTSAPSLEAGVYVISATELLGVYRPSVRDSFWTAEAGQRALELVRESQTPLPESATAQERERRTVVEQAPREGRCMRLIQQLRHRKPDDRVGRSLFVYRLSAEELHRLTRFPGE
jgi:hypothetical protein